MIRWNSQRELPFCRCQTGVRIIDEQATDTDFHTVLGDAKNGFTIYQPVDWNYENRLTALELYRRGFSDNRDTEALGFKTNLFAKEMVGRDVNSGTLLFVQAGLKNKETDDRF